MSSESHAAQPEAAAEVGPRVFATYSHDSPEHQALVREFCTFLRVEEGVDVHLDQWDDDGTRDWAAWAVEQVREADFIVAIASPAYRRRAEGLVAAEEGRGARFETALICDGLTRDLVAETRRILSVVLPGHSVEEIPSFLRPYSTTHYVIDEISHEGLKPLMAAICGVAEYPRPRLGPFAGNPYADLHARLQAEEQRGHVRPTTTPTPAEPPPGMTNNGIANFGQFDVHGDVVNGDKVMERPLR